MPRKVGLVPSRWRGRVRYIDAAEELDSYGMPLLPFAWMLEPVRLGVALHAYVVLGRRADERATRWHHFELPESWAWDKHGRLPVRWEEQVLGKFPDDLRSMGIAIVCYPAGLGPSNQPPTRTRAASWSLCVAAITRATTRPVQASSPSWPNGSTDGGSRSNATASSQCSLRSLWAAIHRPPHRVRPRRAHSPVVPEVSKDAPTPRSSPACLCSGGLPHHLQPEAR